MSKKDLMIGMAVGAAVAFLADPHSGRRRRGRARDQVIRAGRRTRDAVGTSARQLASRSTRMMASTRGRWTHENADDRRLTDLVRAKLGQVCSNPEAIDVASADGIITLHGPVQAREMDDVLAAVWSVRGVLAVNNGLDERHPWNMPSQQPALQIDGWNFAPQAREVSQRWARPTQALMTAAGLTATGLAVAAYARRAQ
jgi:gas vesicle protein